MKVRFLFFLGGCVLSFTALIAQPGVLDFKFGKDGIVKIQRYPSSSVWDAINELAIRPDGKIVAAGFSGHEGCLVQLNTNGSLDTFFGDSGLVCINTLPNISQQNVLFNAISLQNDGKIIATGNTNFYISDTDEGFVARFLEDGTFDTAFGQEGVSRYPFFYLEKVKSSLIKIQPDGKIIFGGSATSTLDGTKSCIVGRLKQDGSRDSLFGINGWKGFRFNNSQSRVTAIALQPDGKILIVGERETASSPPKVDLTAIRFLANGNVDADFGLGGVFTSLLFSDYDVAFDVALLPDGKIIIGAAIGNSTDYKRTALIRLQPNGTIDSTFGVFGITSNTLADLITPARFVLQPDSKIVVAGYAGTLYYEDFALIRFNQDGSLDSLFGTNGLVITQQPGKYQKLNTVALQADQKIVAAGLSQNIPADYPFEIMTIARYQAFKDTVIIDTMEVDTTTQDNDSCVVLSKPFVYPNPIVAEGMLKYKFETPGIISIQLFDMTGRLIQTYVSKQFRNKGVHCEPIIWPEGLPIGMYTIKIEKAHESSIVRVAKQ